MREFAALRVFGLKLKLADLNFSGVSAEAENIETIAPQCGDIVVVQKNNLTCVGDNGVRVTGEKVFPITDADNQRRAAARADHHVRLFSADDSQSVAADDFVERLNNRLGERIQLRLLLGTFVVMFADQVCENFRVCA